MVSGKSEPDTVILTRDINNDLTIDTKTLGLKNKMIQMTETGVEELNGLDGFSINDEQILTLGRVGVYLEERFGSARDIEWAYFQNRLYLLQARPITTLNFWTNDELLNEFDSATLSNSMIYTTANVGEVLSGAMPVLTLTTGVTVVEHAMQEAIHHGIDSYQFKCFQIYQHHVFIDLLGVI